jgi:hypothetical protein
MNIALIALGTILNVLSFLRNAFVFTLYLIIFSCSITTIGIGGLLLIISPWELGFTEQSLLLMLIAIPTVMIGILGLRLLDFLQSKIPTIDVGVEFPGF